MTYVCPTSCQYAADVGVPGAATPPCPGGYCEHYAPGCPACDEPTCPGPDYCQPVDDGPYEPLVRCTTCRPSPILDGRDHCGHEPEGPLVTGTGYHRDRLGEEPVVDPTPEQARTAAYGAVLLGENVEERRMFLDMLDLPRHLR